MIHGGEVYDKKIEYDFSVNLNPMPCPETVTKALKDAISHVDKYPDIDQREFRSAVADSFNRRVMEMADLLRRKWSLVETVHQSCLQLL